jgi:DNA-binding response OmpR family regulator
LTERHHQSKGARILVVEDNEDVRQMMAVALQTHGHAVEEAADAVQALRHLQQGGFDVVLSDYELPDQTGAAMLREAAASGLLGKATALIVTAHSEKEDTQGFDVIPKPIDLGHLMAQVQAVVQSPAAPLAPAAAADGGPPPADLVLYVAAGSAASARARRTMDTILRESAAGSIRYTVCDVAAEPEKAEQDHIVFAPTLVKRSPGPRTWVLGDLADAAVVKDLLKMCGPNRSP